MAESKKSSFSVTCSRLSQFIRDRRSFADIGPQDSYRPPTTLNLLPGLDVPADTETGTDTDAPLTIFYGGKIMVFDNVSAEKAADIMNLATRGAAFNGPVKINTADVPMPMARRASLHRFLEKRKDRINSKAPYQMNGLSSKVGPTDEAHKESKAWLGLGQGMLDLN